MRKTVSIVLVVAGLAAGCMSGGGDEAAPTASAPQAGSTPAEPPAPEPPSSFTVEATPFEVVLAWDPPPEEVERFEIFRDGRFLATQSGASTSYTDDDVVPGQAYEYEIGSATGEVETERVSADAETPVPPLRAARLEGTFNIATRFTSKTGYGDYSRPSYGWRFVPRCREGACNVAWRDIHDRGFRSRLERHGPRYRGSYTGEIGMACEDAPMTTTIEVDLRVVAAEAIDGEWIATRLRGTIDQTDPAQLGCRSGAATMAVRARLAQ
jgi:hypothetical protein